MPVRAGRPRATERTGFPTRGGVAKRILCLRGSTPPSARRSLCLHSGMHVVEHELTPGRHRGRPAVSIAKRSALPRIVDA